MILTDFIPLKQKGIQLYITKLTVEELINNSIVAVFNSKTEEGYQRPPIPSHYKRFAEYLKRENGVLLPLGILTAINPENIEMSRTSGELTNYFSKDPTINEDDLEEGIVKQEEGCNYINELRLQGPLRIVDGQHRIEGFKYLANDDPKRFQEYQSFEIPVTIMVIGKEDEVEEMDTFININSKSKKIDTNLAIRLRHERRKEKNYTRSLHEIIDDIAISVTKKLNEDLNSVWYKAITMAPDDKGKIVSLNAFNKSLIPLVELFIQYYREPKDIEDSLFGFDGEEQEPLKLNDELVPILEEKEDSFVELIKSYLDHIWSIVRTEWDDCFNTYPPYFDKYYNIQKGIGLYSIHLVLQDCIKEEENIESAMYSFKELIRSGRVNSGDWESGGSFSGNNSQAGFRLIANQILGKKIK